MQTIGSIGAGAACDRGTVRESNEDRCFYRTFSYTGELGPERGVIAAVADGMGGHAAGEAASEMAVQIFAAKFAGMASREMSRQPSPDWPDLLRDAFEEANYEVCSEAARWAGRTGMGTTLTAVVLVDDVMYFAHVGDSRAYIIRNGQMIRLTEDHTWVAKCVRDGKMSQDEAETSDRRGQLTEAIGMRDGIHPQIDAIALRPGDRILMCTDGITEMIPEEETLSICERGSDPQKIAMRLVDSANRAGGFDNIAVVFLECLAERRNQRERARWSPKRLSRNVIVALVIIAALLLADAAYIASRYLSGPQSMRQSVTQPYPASDKGAPSPDGNATDPQMIDLSGREVGVTPK
jgi:protein phosphatase